MPKTLPRTCQKLREQLPEYAEGRLYGAPATEIARHLVTCPRCTQEVADLRAMLGVLHALPAEDLPEGLVAGLTEAVGRRAPTRGPAPFWSRLALPATVATGVLAVLLTLHTLEQNGDRLPGNGLMRAPLTEAPEMQLQVRAGAPNPKTVAPRVKAAPETAPTVTSGPLWILTVSVCPRCAGPEPGKCTWAGGTRARA